MPDSLPTLALERPLAVLVSGGSQGQVSPGHVVPREYCPLDDSGVDIPQN